MDVQLSHPQGKTPTSPVFWPSALLANRETFGCVDPAFHAPPPFISNASRALAPGTQLMSIVSCAPGP